MDYLKLKNLVDEGYSTRKIGDFVELKQTAVRYWLKKYGLKTNPKLLPQNVAKAYSPKCACGETNPENFYGNKNMFAENVTTNIPLIAAEKIEPELLNIWVENVFIVILTNMNVL